MDDASVQYARLIETSRAATGRGDRAAAVEALTQAIEIARSDAALHKELTAALVRLGTVKRELGQVAEAEQLITEAIAIGERQLGAEHPSLAVALNELSRLYIRRADFTRAEPLLDRLLRITRAKGERHPDYATALAGLAVAKRGLGDNAAAERLYRDALSIREEVLAPNHMAIVITLEQLAETCAARDNFTEALALLQRALPTRESAVGADHASVHALRARITDLELRALVSNATAPVAPVAPPTPVAETPAPVEAPATVAAAPLAEKPPRTSGEWRGTPVRLEAIAAAPRTSGPTDLTYLYLPEPATPRAASPASVPVAKPITPVASHARALSPARGSVATRSPVLPLTPVPPSADAQAFASPLELPARGSRRKFAKRNVLVAASVLVLAVAGFGFRSLTANKSESAAGQIGGETNDVASAPTAEPMQAGAPMVVAEKRPAAESATTVSEERTPDHSREAKPSVSDDARPSAPAALVALPTLRKLVMPKVTTPNVDDVLKSATKGSRDLDAESIGAGVTALPKPTSNETAAVTLPVLIGVAPTPKYPDELRAHPIEGEVVVQFRVNEKGRVEPGSMQVLHSQHELLTAAVRNTLPRFRFEPARGGPDAKPQAAWVQFRTEFSAKK